MLQWTALKLPEAEQRILDLQRTTVTDSDIFYENSLSTQSEQSSNSSKTLSETNKAENRRATRSRFSIISPRTMPKKLEKIENSTVQPESLYESIENYDKTPEGEDKAKNHYVGSRELLDKWSENLDDSDTIDPEIQDLVNSPPAEMSNKFKNKLKELENVTLNIAVTGMTGAGKSSFVNSLRGLRNDDSRAAPTGVTETTLEPTMYPHPSMPNVNIWDLPGIGSPKFKAKKYLKDVKFITYDFFLIVTSERFKENDIELAKAIQKNKKLFYFIRTKIDNDLQAEGHKRGFIEQRVLDKIREDCEKNLRKVGKPKVFLISTFHLDKFDFPRLVDTLEEELPENKRFALIQSLPVYSIEALIKKKTYFKKMIWLNAFAAGVGAIPPIPGLSVICDYGIMKNFFKQVFTGFSLSDDALESLSERVTKPVNLLKAAKTSRFKDGVSKAVVMDMLSKPVIAVAKTLGTVMALLPGGALPAAGTAVASVHYLLNLGLNEMAEDTKKILIAAKLAQLQSMLQWTVLKLPEAEQKIQDLQQTTMTDSDIFYENSTQSEQSSNSSKTLGDTDVDEGRGPPRTRCSINNPRTMLKKLEKNENTVQSESLYESTENYNKTLEGEVKAENSYIVSRELFDVWSKSSEDSDIIDFEIKDVLKSSPAEISSKFQNKLKELENVTLNIAVTGMTGAGKSSFVNSLRGLQSDDSKAAATGAVETTLKPTMYPHPTMPNVKIWDLPGIGSQKFKAKKYLKDVKFSTYDFFLIVTSERFKENDIKLAKAIQRYKKLFFFIRTKIDNDLRAEKHKRGFIEQRVLEQIREDCEKNLQKVGNPKVFLISSFQLEKFDFQRLVDTLEVELPENKRFALIQSLPVYSIEALIKKKTYFRKMIWLNAFAAGVGAIPPIPGLSVICDYGIMKNFFKQVFTGFSLSDDALESLSERVNKPVKLLKAAKTSRFKDGVSEAILMDMMSKPVIAVAKTLGTVMALLPGGALPAAGIDVASVHYLLNLGLNEMAEDTKNVLIKAQLAVTD
ncbi:uncharacterized protein [Misgurnus anguillicaudatus]|uniref:uncharacterized protein n=1 Tax=Misgurnus anguillicaudatus TaxID=75329 RepID=UPI003CCFC642